MYATTQEDDGHGYFIQKKMKKGWEDGGCVTSKQKLTSVKAVLDQKVDAQNEELDTIQ